jgi:hypothetical protein
MRSMLILFFHLCLSDLDRNGRHLKSFKLCGAPGSAKENLQTESRH